MTDQNQTPPQTPPPPPPQTSPQPPAQSPPPASQGKSGPSTGMVIGIVIVVLVALGAILYLVFGGGNNAAATAPVPPEITLPTPVPGTPLATALTGINLRSGPSVNFPSYGVAPEGARGVVIGVSEDGGWWVVQVDNTALVPPGQAWVSGDYVQVENVEGVPVIPSPDLPPGVDIPSPDPNGPIATALDAINVRSGPGTEYPSYGIAQQGAQGKVIGISENERWWVVELPTSLVGAGQGWVSADWVLVENVEGVPVIPAP